MIVWTPFKNFSSSIEAFLTSANDGWQIIHSRQPFTDYVDSHGGELPAHTMNYEQWLPLRDPFRRVGSMWRYAVMKGSKVSFPEWLETSFYDRHLSPVSSLYTHHVPVRVEQLAEVFKSKGMDYGEMPHLNRSTAPGHRLTREEKVTIIKHHWPDFLIGGYQNLGIWPGRQIKVHRTDSAQNARNC